MSINLKEEIRPLSYIKTNALDMINYINEKRNPIIVTQDEEACGVLLDVESYQNMVNAISIMKLIQISEKAIDSGNVFENNEVFSELHKRIDAKQI
jgi:PHD/YefM family antitoxin component YafN of YafNO toxin-antitoxin module